MKLEILKKSFILSLATVLAFLFISCSINNNGKEETSIQSSQNSKLFNKINDLSILIGSHSSWPYDENFEFWKYFREATGANLKITSIPNTEFETKLSLMMASRKKIPDLIHMLSKSIVDKYVADGAFIAIDDYKDKMPNYTNFWNSIPEETRKAYLVQRISADGKTYFPQVYGYDRVMNLQVWMNRKDIFEKNNLKVPETLDEMYDVALKLKKLYPNSYPICLRNGLGKLNVIGPQFKPYFAYDLYYDFPNKKWSYGATEPTMLEIVQYLNKLRDAKLIPPDYLTINKKTWEELVSTDRGFIMTEFMVRFDFFNLPNRTRDPKYTWSIMAPPRANNKAGQNLVAKFNSDPTGYVICNTGNKKRIDDAIKLVDWMYSEAATDLLSWGKEGETYKIEDGKRRFIVDKGVNPTAKYGVLSYGLYQRLDPAAVTAAYSDEQAEMTDFAIKHLETNINPINWLALNQEEGNAVKDIRTSLKSYVEERISKFLLEQEPLSNWDSFQKDLKSMGVDELLKVYNSAFIRATAGK